jgi:microcystin-dependent protein
MGSTNYGTQIIVFDYKYPLKGIDFNWLLRDILPAGIYKGGDLIVSGANQVTINPLVAVAYSDAYRATRIQTTAPVTLNIIESSPKVYLTYTYIETEDNYADFGVEAVGATVTNEIVLGVGRFSGGVLVGFDYTTRNYGSTHNTSGMKTADKAYIPVGTIFPYLPGYFTDGNNGGWQEITLTLPNHLAFCDGSVLLDYESPIFNGAGRRLPNLTDNRFVMGSTGYGSVSSAGGTNTNTKTLSISEMPTHSHTHGTDGSGTNGLISGPSMNHTHGTVYANPGALWFNTTAPMYGWSNGAGAVAQPNVWVGPSSDDVHYHSFNIGYTGGGASFSLLPRYLTAKYVMCIK